MARFLWVFGAGASFGAGDTIPKVPPMSDELLSALERLYPQAWGQLPPDIRASLVEDFEQGMTILGDRAPMVL